MSNDYTRKTFYEMYQDEDAFLEDMRTQLNNMIGPGGRVPGDSTTIISDNGLVTTWFLLMGKYGNTPFANKDSYLIPIKMANIIYQYGPAWEKRKEIQIALKGLGLESDALLNGSLNVFNHASNPGTTPSTADTQELTYVDAQNTSRVRKSKMDAYRELYDIMGSDVTQMYVDKFKPLFEPMFLYMPEEDA